MEFKSLFIIAFALSLDAFGTALSIGLDKNVKFKHKILFSLSFGFFQFFLSLIGAYLGFYFNTYIISIPKIIGGIIIILVGLVMIIEGFDKNKESIFIDSKMYFILGISVSIDAMVIGFTALNNIESNIIILNSTLFIGIVTFIISAIAFFISKLLKKIEIVSRYADYIGGIILILFGANMIFF